MFISNKRTSVHLWRKENLVKHQKVSKYYENDCRYIKRRVYICDGPNNTCHADGNDKLNHMSFLCIIAYNGFLIKVL